MVQPEMKEDESYQQWEREQREKMSFFSLIHSKRFWLFVFGVIVGWQICHVFTTPYDKLVEEQQAQQDSYFATDGE
jgi:hypothetical protein